MTIELTVLLSAISVGFGVFIGMTNAKRSERNEIKSDTSSLTTVIVKLESIGVGITEIKTEMNNVKEEQKESRERIIKVEESAKQAHKRLDSIDARRKEV